MHMFVAIVEPSVLDYASFPEDILMRESIACEYALIFAPLGNTSDLMS